MSAPAASDPWPRRLALAGAILFLAGALQGGLIAEAMMGRLDADARTLVGAHLNALLGTFWLLGVGWSLRFARLGAGGRTALGALAITSAYANFVVTAAKAFLRVHGVAATGERANDAIFGTLTLLVVVPTVLSAALWVWALRPGGPAPAEV